MPQAIDVASEVINSYGDLPNSELLRRYGFVEGSPNPNDNVDVSIWEFVEQSICQLFLPDESKIKQRVDFLIENDLYPQGGWFSILNKRHLAALIECLRVLSISCSQFRRLQKEVNTWRFPKPRPMQYPSESDFKYDILELLIRFADQKVKTLFKTCECIEEGCRDIQGQSRAEMARVVVASELDVWRFFRQGVENGISQLEYPCLAWKDIICRHSEH